MDGEAPAEDENWNWQHMDLWRKQTPESLWEVGLQEALRVDNKSGTHLQCMQE